MRNIINYSLLLAVLFTFNLPLTAIAESDQDNGIEAPEKTIKKKNKKIRRLRKRIKELEAQSIYYEAEIENLNKEVPYSHGIKMFDANWNFIGYCISNKNLGSTFEVFIPSLKLFVNLQRDSDRSYSVETTSPIYIDAEENRYLTQPFNLVRIPVESHGDVYFRGNREAVEVEIVGILSPGGDFAPFDPPVTGWYHEAVEIPVNELTFPLPLEQPFYFDY